jgi:hypothetical protein
VQLLRTGADSPTPGTALVLQRLLGNQGFSQAVEESRHEHGPSCGHQAPVQRKTAVQRKMGVRNLRDESAQAEIEQTQIASQAVKKVLASRGQPIEPRLRAEAEARLGDDFSSVQQHSDQTALDSATKIRASAYASGEHVVIRRNPKLKDLLHELAHVQDQRKGAVPGTNNGAGLQMSHKDDAGERSAVARSERAMAAPVQRAAVDPAKEETN